MEISFTTRVPIDGFWVGVENDGDWMGQTIVLSFPRKKISLSLTETRAYKVIGFKRGENQEAVEVFRKTFKP